MVVPTIDLAGEEDEANWRGVGMLETGLRRNSSLGRRVRRHIERAAETWIQTRLIAGLILLAAVLSIVATSDLTKASGGGPSERTDVTGRQSSGSPGGDCGARIDDSMPGAIHAHAQ